MTLIELLARYAGASLVERSEDPCLVTALITFPDSRRLILVERTYREGIRVIHEPTDAEVTVLHGDDLWKLWNSDRSEYLGGAVER